MTMVIGTCVCRFIIFLVVMVMFLVMMVTFLVLMMLLFQLILFILFRFLLSQQSLFFFILKKKLLDISRNLIFIMTLPFQKPFSIQFLDWSYLTIPWESRHRTMRPPPSLPGLVTEASPGASGLELWTRQWAPGNWAKGTNTTSPDTAVK